MNLSQPLFIIADPHVSNIAYYSELLQAMNVRALATEQGQHLHELVANHQPALLILDSGFNQPDSYHLLDLLKSDDRTAHVPVLFVTANLSEHKIALHAELFARVDLITKPINERHLQDRLKRYLTLNRLRNQIATLNANIGKNMLEGRDEGVLGLDHHGQILFANAAAERLLKTTALKLAGNYLESLLEEACNSVNSRWKDHPITKVTRTDQILQVDKAMLNRADGERINVKFAVIPVNSLPDVATLFAFRQLKESRESRDKLARLSHVDHLTKLPLRIALEEQIERCLLKSALSGFYFALLSVDLDHFRYINESIGHDRGDQLIREVVQRILAVIRRDDMVGRMEGDEFVVVLTHIELPENAGLVAQKIIDQIRKAFLIDGHQVFTGCSIGISVYPTCGDDASTLLKNAEAALSRAKLLGRNNYQYFTAEMNKQRVEQMQLEFELHQAVEQNRWRVQFQPVLALATMQVVACEIKLSWINPGRGEMMLDEFLPMAEESGLAPAIFRWFWQHALMRLATLNPEQRGNLQLLMPVSPSLLLQEGGMEWLSGMVKEQGIEPGHILIQIPESSLAARHGQLSSVLNSLCKQGFQLVLDNFGNGFAPLKWLREIPCSLLRLGAPFIASIDSACIDQSIVKGVLNLAHEMGLKVLAADVNNSAQFRFLQDNGCDWLTGDAVQEQIGGLPLQIDASGFLVFPG